MQVSSGASFIPDEPAQLAGLMLFGGARRMEQR